MMPLVECRTVKRYFIAGRGFSSIRRAYEYAAKREINAEIRESDGVTHHGKMFPLDKCPISLRPEMNGISCRNYGRPFCFCQFKKFVRDRAAELMIEDGQ